MLEINIKEARSKFSAILERVEKGEDVIITRRGKRIARMSNLNEDPVPLGSLEKFRRNIEIMGLPLSRIVVDQRDKERY